MLRPSTATALAVATMLTLAACGSNAASVLSVAAEAPTPMTATVFPQANATGVAPDTVISVDVGDGVLETVRVRDRDGEAMSGRYSPDSTVWISEGRLRPNQHYTVQVSGRSPTGIASVATSRFATLEVPEEQLLRPSQIAPLNGSTVGVAQPVVVGFSRPVRNRVAITDALRVTSSPAVEGGWFWIDAMTVHYRPEKFWPAGTKVRLDTGLSGLRDGADAWGGDDRTVSFDIGRKQVIRVDAQRHEMQVFRDNDLLRTMEVSTGKPGWETRNGVKVLMEKVAGKTWTNEAIDAPEDYRLYSQHAMRLTNSGEFIHDAPWNLRNIGRASTSHGCVGMAPSDMAWLFSRSMVGDPVIVSGSPRPYTELWNRYQDWNVPWEQWQGGNLDLSEG